MGFEVVPCAGVEDGLFGVVATQDGAIWFAAESGRVGRRDPDGSVTALDLAGSTPAGLAAATESTIWVADCAGNRLLHLRPGAGALTVLRELAVPTRGAQPREVVGLDDGTAWFAHGSADVLGRIDILGRVEEYLIGRDGSGVAGIAGDGDSVWFALHGVAALGHVRGGDAAVALTALPAESGPRGVAVAGDGAVWTALSSADALARRDRTGTVTIVPLPARTAPAAVAAGRRGGAASEVWASLGGADALAQVTAGRVRLHPLPGGVRGPRGIVVAPDGRVWVVAQTGELLAFTAE